MLLIKKTTTVILFFMSFMALAHEAKWQILKQKNVYFITDTKMLIPIEISGVPEIQKHYHKGPLTIVEYLSGEFGTTSLIKVYRRAVIKDHKLIVDAAYKYSAQEKIEQPKWDIDLTKKIITITDESEDDGNTSIKF